MSSMNINTEITLNLLRPNSNVVVYAKQYDTGTRTIDVNLVAGTQVWDPPTGIQMLVMYIKPDGKQGVYDTIEDGSTAAVTRIGTGKVRITLAEQALTCPGNVLVQISFFRTGQRSTTLSFVVNVEKGTPSDGDLESNDYFSILSNMIDSLLEATVHPPTINPTTLNWMLWEDMAQGYIDSGYSSVGTITVDTDITYQVGTSGTTPPTGEWSSTVPSVAQGQYLWTKTVLTFGDGTTATSYQSAYHGTDGVIMVDTVIEYQASPYGTTPPTGAWSSSIPSVPQGQFLWSRTVLKFNDGSQAIAYQVSRNGIDGMGSVRTVDGISPDSNGNVVVMLSVAVSSFSSLPVTVNNAAITDRHVVLEYTLSNPSAQVDDWVLETSSGQLTVSGTISGETSLTVVLGAASA